MYADDILLYKPIYCPEDYGNLQQDIDAINGCTQACHLKLNPSKCKYIIASKKRQPLYPSRGLFLGNFIMEQVDSYRYLGVTVTSTLNWNDHIQHICSKARKLVGMLHRRFSSWTDTNTLMCLYLTCVRPHLEYASQLWAFHCYITAWWFYPYKQSTLWITKSPICSMSQACLMLFYNDDTQQQALLI